VRKKLLLRNQNQRNCASVGEFKNRYGSMPCTGDRWYNALAL